MRELVNLIVDLDDRFADAPASERGLTIARAAAPDETTLAWIDATFGGTWSSEANAGSNVVAFRDGAPAGFATYDAKLKFAWLRGVAREPGVGVFGPFGVDPSERGTGLGVRLLHGALAGLRERGYARALIAAVGSERLVRYYAQTAGARVVETYDPAVEIKRTRTVVLASGSGSNFQAVLDASRSGELPLDVAALVCNRPDAYAIERARVAGVPSILTLPWKRAERTRADYDALLLSEVEAEAPSLVLLLGWMHLLAEPFVRAFPEMLNIHPAFLPLDPDADDVGLPDGTRMPAFRGAHAVRDAIAAGSRWMGATLHGVTPQTDRGPVLARAPMPLQTGDDEDRALARLHPLEHRLVSAGIRRWLYER